MTQQNRKCRLYGDKDETINHIISECGKLAQKEYKTRYDRVGKAIHWERCKNWNLTIRTTQNQSWRMRLNHLWDFEIQTVHLMSARQLDIIIINNNKKKKITCRIVDFAVLADFGVKSKESEKRDKYLSLLGNWKNCGIWKWWGYQLHLVLLVQSPKDWYKN